MQLFVKRQMWLLLVMVCLMMVSCGPKHTDKPTQYPKKADSHDGLNVMRSPLSKEQVIKAANAEACNRGRYPEQSIVIFDEGNATWNAIFSSM